MKITTIIITATLACLAHAEPSKKQKGRILPPHIVEKFDTDGDGTLNKGERKAAFQERKAERKAFRDSFDTNQDGELSADERTAFKAAREEKIIKRFDTDGDGQLNADEQEKADKAKKLMKRMGKKLGKKKD